MSRRLLKLFLCGIIFIATASPGGAGPKEDAYAAIEHWAAMFNANDVEKLIASYTPDAMVLAVSPAVASTPDDLRKHFSGLPTNKTQVKLGEFSAIVLSNEAVLFAGFCEFWRAHAGQKVTRPAIYSFLSVKRDGRWLLAYHHSGPTPVWWTVEVLGSGYSV